MKREHQPKLKIESNDFEQTARAVYLMNDSTRRRYGDHMDLLDFMYSMAYRYMYESHHFSTGGFVLTAYDCADGTRGVTASVMAYTAFEYAKGQQAIRETFSRVIQAS